MTRITRSEYFLGIALTVAQRSTCGRANVGAVLVNDLYHIVATGYNGSPPGADHCIDEGVGCLIHEGHCIRTIHAEMNAIFQLEKKYKKLSLYCTHQPCAQCLKSLVSINCLEIHYLYEYPDPVREKVILDYMHCDGWLMKDLMMKKVVLS